MQSVPGPPIDLAYVRNLLAGAEAQGLSGTELLREEGVSELRPGAVTPLLFVQLARRVQRTLGDEGTGLLARRLPSGTSEVRCCFASYGKNLVEAYQRLVQFEQVLDCGLEHALQVRKDIVVHVVRPTASVLNELAFETALVLHHRLVEWLGGTRLPINRVALCYPRPDHARSYRLLFRRAALAFDQPECRLEMPRAVLERSVKRTEAQAIQWARRAPLDAFLPTQGIDGVALRVASLLERRLREEGDLPDMAGVAKAFGWTVRVLRRRLANEGEAFRALRSLVRRDAAIRLLTTTDRSVEQVAFDVGFTSASPFVRAFRSWTGLSPGAYRRSAL
ncbi:MAG: AraC family transcriptional regulator ligand-binding domain-containing protein [Myxococcota bacterium]